MEFPPDGHVFKVVPEVFGIKERFEQYAFDLDRYKDYQKDLKAFKKGTGPEPEKVAKPEEFKPVYVYLKGISQEENGQAQRKEAAFVSNHTREKATELSGGNAIELVASKVVKIENLTSGGKDLTTFMEVHAHSGLKALALWIVGMVHSEERLTAAEIKN